MWSRAWISIFAVITLTSPAAWASTEAAHWDESSTHQTSILMDPVRESGMSRDGLTLALKRFPHPGAQPVLLIHGLAQNDRGWDSFVKKYSFARFLHAQGFDVWIGNCRSAGTEGFRSETPKGPHHWTIDDYAILDIPGLVDAVKKGTGQAPFIVGHSLAAWAIEGYLAGLTYNREGKVVPRAKLGASRQDRLRGVITIAGIYNMRWPHMLADFTTSPLRNEVDYYQSNYEIELLTKVKPLYRVIPNLPALPLGWIGSILNLPFDRIPIIGKRLTRLYEGFQSEVISTPIFSMFYYVPNSDPEQVRTHVLDGLEDLGPHLIEQLANAKNDGKTASYYHVDRPDSAYNYADVRKHISVPMLFIGGGRDRLASALEIYEDGYLATQARDKQYIHVERGGHLDIYTGLSAPQDVMMPVTKWIRERM